MLRVFSKTSLEESCVVERGKETDTQSAEGEGCQDERSLQPLSSKEEVT